MKKRWIAIVATATALVVVAAALAAQVNTYSVTASTSPTKAGTKEAHGAALGDKEIEGARQNLGWPYPPFEIPEAIFTAWRKVGKRGRSQRRKWTQRHAAMAEADRAEFDRRMAGTIPPEVDQAIVAFKAKVAADKPAWSADSSM